MQIHQGCLRALLLAIVAAGGVGLAKPAAAQAVPGVQLTELPPVAAGADTEAYAVSADGSVVVGLEDSPANLTIWTGGVPENIPLQYQFTQQSALVTNADGSVVGGNLLLGYDGYGSIWSRGGGQIVLPDISANEIVNGVVGLSNDGTVAAISSFYGQHRELLDGSSVPGAVGLSGGGNAYRWTAAGGYVSIGHLTSDPAEWTSVSGISGDGARMSGNALFPDPGTGSLYGRNIAFVWQQNSGFTQLPDLSSHPAVQLANPSGAPTSYTEAISRDGSTVVGWSYGADGVHQAVYWRGGAVTGLGYLTGAYAETTAELVNANGGVIVGSGYSQEVGSYSWRWTAQTGLQNIDAIVANAGLDLGGRNISYISGLSDDGQTMVGVLSGSGDRAFSLRLSQVTHTQLIVRVTLPEVTLTSVVNQHFATTVEGTLNGAKAFSTTVNDTADAPAGQAAFADATAALRVSGLRRVTISAPVLVSTDTKVLSSTASTVNVVNSSGTTSASITNAGPATVATGDLGVCATPAGNGVLPTGCSLAGTPVAVPAGETNTNLYTNVLENVTPTTTQTVEQQITQTWQVAAVGGNQFGTAHALVGPVAFARGDRLTALLLSRGAGSASGETGGQTVASALASDARSLASDGGFVLFGGYFNDRTSIDADPSIPVARVKGASDGLTVGVERTFDGGWRAGLAMDYGESRLHVQDPAYPETLTQSMTQIATYAGWNKGRFSLSASGIYALGRVETTLTTPTGPASARRDVSAWSLGSEARYAAPLGAGELAVVTGVRHTSAKLDGFTESGGPSPLKGVGETVSRTRVFAGLEAALPFAAGGETTITPRFHVRVAHDSGDTAGSAKVVFLSAPNGPALTAYGPNVGEWSAEVGGGVEVAVSGSVSLWGAYDAQLKDHADSHTLRAGLSITF